MAKFSFKRASREVWQSVTTVKRAIITFFALILLVIGIVGSFIPLVPARIIAAPALILLSMYSPTTYALLKRKADGHPKIESWFDRLRNWVIRRLH